MGAGASVEGGPYPYPTVEAAKAAGKTQKEVDDFLAGLNSHRCHPTAALQYFPLYVIPMDTFLGLDRMKAHGELVTAGKAVVWTPELGPINFCSHQWLSNSTPDPDGVQLRSIQRIFRFVIDGEDPFASKGDWERYSERWNYAEGLENVEGDALDDDDKLIWRLSSKTHVVSLDDFCRSVAGGCVWLDFSAIPQSVDEDLVNETFWEKQKRAIHSIPSYVESATNFWVCAPPCAHKDTGEQCDLASWASRGWCRMEDWVNELSVKAHRPLFIDGNKVTVQDFSDKMTHHALPQHAVLRGEFTCCKLGHRLNGEPRPCDKDTIAPVLRWVYQHKLQHLRSTGDLVNHAWFMALRPSLLSGDDSEPALPPDEALPAFLGRYGWTGDDPEGAGAADQPVFFPLFCAACEGNQRMVRALLAAGAAVNRRLLDVGTGPLEAAALCGYVEVCRVLLEEGAALEGSSQLDGATALIKAARGDAVAVAELLLTHGANPHHADHEGRTPLAVAEALGHDRVRDALLRKVPPA